MAGSRTYTDHSLENFFLHKLHGLRKFLVQVHESFGRHAVAVVAAGRPSKAAHDSAPHPMAVMAPGDRDDE